MSDQERVHGHCGAGEKQGSLFFVDLFPVVLSGGAVVMAFVTSAWLAFPELGGHPLHLQPFVLCQRNTVKIFILQGRRRNKAWVLQLIA